MHFSTRKFWEFCGLLIFFHLVTDMALAGWQSSILSAQSTLKGCGIGLAVTRTKWCFSGFGTLVKDDEIAGDFCFLFFFNCLLLLWHKTRRRKRKHFQTGDNKYDKQRRCQDVFTVYSHITMALNHLCFFITPFSPFLLLLDNASVCLSRPLTSLLLVYPH